MPYAVICIDKPGAASLRAATREAHLAYLAAAPVELLEVGPLLGAEGAPIGSLLIIEAASREAAETFAAGDPYGQAGLFASVQIHGYRRVFRDGQRTA